LRSENQGLGKLSAEKKSLLLCGKVRAKNVIEIVRKNRAGPLDRPEKMEREEEGRRCR